MFQIVEALTNTVTKFVDDHGLKVVIGVLAVVGVGLVLKLISRVSGGGGQG
jgi:hypothetical protein